MQASIQKNDKRAKWIIYSLSAVIFLAVVVLDRVKLDFPFDFDVHIFAKINAVINSIVAVLLVGALMAIKNRNVVLHRKLIMAAIISSVLFLLSYICHHVWTDSTPYGGQGMIRSVYYFILITHIILAAVILPFILFTAYRGLTAEYPKHRKLAKYTWPLWFYVSVSGVVVYMMIAPYYGS
ncbi:MAG TPA: DUF420 domain-containing protein [Edaphocola sp.]|nr:DUF420 domain-containing protein [Edaphocola sp.]